MTFRPNLNPTVTRTVAVALVFFIAGCQQSGTYEPEGDWYPPGSIIEAYDDSPGLVRLTVQSENGNITGEGNFLNGRHHGTWSEYSDSDGYITSIQTWFEGKKEGVFMQFDRGKITEKSYYHNDELHGIKLTYGRYGVVAEEIYKNGQLDGVIRKFYDNRDRIVMEEAPYSNGVLHGTARWYDKDGNLLFQYQYENGELVDDNPGDSIR